MEKHKGRKGRQNTGSIDGIVQSGRTIGFPTHSSYQPNRQAPTPTPTLDNFRLRTDGFHPQREAMPAHQLDQSEAEEAHLLDEPIILDDIRERKRKLRFWQRHAKLKRRLKKTAMAFTVLVLAAGGYFGYKLYTTQKRVLAGGGRAAAICTDNVDVSQLHHEGDSRINILLLGIGGPGHDGPNLTDTILLASIDPINDSSVLLSIPRDLWVNIPGVGYDKINAAYPDGLAASRSKTALGQKSDGLTLLDKTLQPVLDGVPIHYHVLLNFEAFKQTVDALGGVTVNVPETLYDPTIAWENHNNPVIAVKGVQHMDGDQALLYARSRETSSDFARGERQRLLISAIKQKALSAGTFANPLKISGLLSSLGNNVFTDFSSTDVRCLYHQLSTIPSSSIKSLDMVTPPNQLLTTGTEFRGSSATSAVEPLAGVGNYSAIHVFLRSRLPDPYIKKENAPIAIYNATGTAGLATAEAGQLKQYGYNIRKVDSAPNITSPSEPILVNLSGSQDKYTLNYLESRLGVTAVGRVPSQFGINPPQGVKFVIILGSNASSSLPD